MLHTENKTHSQTKWQMCDWIKYIPNLVAHAVEGIGWCFFSSLGHGEFSEFIWTFV
jgi:hypothetical protein